MKIRLLTLLLLTSLAGFAQKPPRPVPPLRTGVEGKLVYLLDERGNRIPDFSYCGYEMSTKELPTVPVRVVVSPKEGDATYRIQMALDYVAELPADANGYRGAVLLEKGRYNIAGSLYIRASGVVLRGSGMGADGTLLFAAGDHRETLIRIAGKNDCISGPGVAVTNAYLPVNAQGLSVAKAAFKAGDRVRIRRPSTMEWITLTGMESFGGGLSSIGWKPGNEDIFWDRTVQAVDDNDIQLDAPLTTDMDPAYAIDTVYPVSWPGRIQQSGVENLQLESAWDESNPKDENHRWMAITLENIENGWVRRVVFRHFAGSAVYALETASKITVEDCKSFAPVSEIGGYRRNTYLNDGQLNLFQRCTAEQGIHDFAVGHCAAGPNAFVQCFSYLPYGFSGTLGSWASGVLFDNVKVDGNALSYANRGQDGQGAGWSAANSMFWQCEAALIVCPKPTGAQNWAFGSWSQFHGDGSWWSSNDHISPYSLFYTQLAERMDKMAEWAGLMPSTGEPSSNPPIEVAMALSKDARQPALQLGEWIDTLVRRHPISLDDKGVRNLNQFIRPQSDIGIPRMEDLSLKNGWLVRGNNVVVGARRGISFWNGNLKSNYVNSLACQPHLTRWVPGRSGTGFTDDLVELTDQMKNQHIVALDHHYALWYDRRRDDHEKLRRMDGDVWAPFYELPFARSGQGQAYDGLSKYDLTKWNTWYWHRLNEYASLADEKGLLLFHQNYFQHNIIEAGAHWADFPWRSANNINNTGFPEPTNYAGDKRVFMAEQFYDLSDPVRKALHRNYIRKCLDNFSSNGSVIQFLSDEYTGPKHFVEFWLDVIGEWERETGINALVCLSVTKDVQDSILADPKYNALVEIIDTKYWRYEAGGKMFAPPGGKNLAPRQHQRLKNQKKDMVAGNPPSIRASKAKTEEDLIYWTVRDYRDAHPTKAVLFSSEMSWIGWPAFMAGGSVSTLPGPLPEGFLATASMTKPMDSLDPESTWLLGNTAGAFILYVKEGNSVRLDLTACSGVWKGQWLNPRDGQPIGKSFKVATGRIYTAQLPVKGPQIVWIYK
jgi:hypothetical protein